MNEFDEWRAQDITGYINGTGNLNNLTATEGTYAGLMWQVEEPLQNPHLKFGLFSYLSRRGMMMLRYPTFLLNGCITPTPEGCITQ